VIVAWEMKAMVWAVLLLDLADYCLRDLAAAEAAAVLPAPCAGAEGPSALASILEVDEKVAVVAAG
jgi:hypothetical protein